LPNRKGAGTFGTWGYRLFSGVFRPDLML